MSIPVASRSSSVLCELKTKAKVLRNTLRNSLPPVAVPEVQLCRKRSHSFEGSQGDEKRQRIKANPHRVLEAQMNTTPVLGGLNESVKEVKVQPSFKKSRKEFKEFREKREDEEKRTLFLGNVPVSVKSKELKKLCSAFGEVSSIRFRNIFGASDMSRGVAAMRKEFSDAITHCCAFVVFESGVSAADAARHLKGTKLGNRHINASLASEKNSCATKFSVFVSSLPKDADEEEVRLLFRHFGPVESVRLVRDESSGSCRGFGFVQFKDSVGLTLCLKTEKHSLRNRTIRVVKCTKKGKGKRMTHQESHYTKELSNQKTKPKDRKGKSSKVNSKKTQYVKQKDKKPNEKAKKPSKKHKSSLI